MPADTDFPLPVADPDGAPESTRRVDIRTAQHDFTLWYSASGGTTCDIDAVGMFPS